MRRWQPALVLVGLACGTEKEPGIHADRGVGSCTETCLELEETALGMIAREDFGTEEYEALCAQAPASDDCETCFAFMQEEVYSPYDIGWSCGCGLDLAGVAECLKDPEIEEDYAAGLLESCEQQCVDHRLALPARRAPGRG